jgi:DNA-3-methyladenine glycosylase
LTVPGRTGDRKPGGEPAAAPFDGFYDRSVLAVARDLLGATVRHGPVAVRLTEVEAYGGPDDPASHAARGPTPRASVMFGPSGRAYVYFIYGMHWCLNVVCGPPGTASAVLLRGAAVVDGLAAVRARHPRLAVPHLARGPGRLARALGVEGTLTGSDVTGGGPLTISVCPPAAEASVAVGPRVGVRLAADRPWRLWLAGEPSVSAGPWRRTDR